MGFDGCPEIVVIVPSEGIIHPYALVKRQGEIAAAPCVIAHGSAQRKPSPIRFQQSVARHREIVLQEVGLVSRFQRSVVHKIHSRAVGKTRVELTPVAYRRTGGKIMVPRLARRVVNRRKVDENAVIRSVGHFLVLKHRRSHILYGIISEIYLGTQLHSGDIDTFVGQLHRAVRRMRKSQLRVQRGAVAHMPVDRKTERDECIKMGAYKQVVGIGYRIVSICKIRQSKVKKSTKLPVLTLVKRHFERCPERKPFADEGACDMLIAKFNTEIRIVPVIFPILRANHTCAHTNINPCHIHTAEHWTVGRFVGNYHAAIGAERHVTPVAETALRKALGRYQQSGCKQQRNYFGYQTRASHNSLCN